MKTKSDRSLGQAQIEKLAGAAEDGFDLSTWRPRRGRPALSRAGTGHSPRVGARVSAETYTEFIERAGAEGRTPSEVVRSLVEGYVANSRRRRHR